MTKRMLMDCTHAEETRVVIIDNNKLQDVEFETINRKPIKGNIYMAKVMRVEPSLQACFVDYGGNRHGFLAFGEIHPDYYNISDEKLAEVTQEVEASLEAKKNRNKKVKEEDVKPEVEAEAVEVVEASENAAAEAKKPVKKTRKPKKKAEEVVEAETPKEAEKETEKEAFVEEDKENKEDKPKKKKFVRRKAVDKTTEIACATGCEEDVVVENVIIEDTNNDEDEVDEDDENDNDEIVKKLMISKKLFYSHKIQEVIKEGQILLVQVVKEERGNKGAALTTYLSMAGRYCVLMPNKVKSGGVSRKITNQSDRKRLKNVVGELPLNSDMSLIVRTAGEEKTKQDITRDYNYLIRAWNKVREAALKVKAPAMIHEEGNLIKRALRDMYSKEISEVVVDGYDGYKTAKEFFKILAPHNLKKIKLYKNSDLPMFQRYQVEGQLDKLHDPVAQLESGGYIVINPTEALVSIDVNSGRATKEKDLEETALKTNLEACDEIAKQLRIRNLAGLVVIDFIDMDEHKHNNAVEKRMKEALKQDRSKVQVGKMSIFGLLELSRQRMHSSFFESTYQSCPHCQGRGIVRSKHSCSMMILRAIEEEGSKNRSSKLNLWVPTDIAIHLLNANRKKIGMMEDKYSLEVCIYADDSILNVNDYKMEKIKIAKQEAVERTEVEDFAKQNTQKPEEAVVEDVSVDSKRKNSKSNWWKKLVKS